MEAMHPPKKVKTHYCFYYLLHILSSGVPPSQLLRTSTLVFVSLFLSTSYRSFLLWVPDRGVTQRCYFSVSIHANSKCYTAKGMHPSPPLLPQLQDNMKSSMESLHKLLFVLRL